MPLEKYLTLSEVAKYLRVSDSTIYKYLNGKNLPEGISRLPAIKVGKQWRIPEGKLENWINQQLSN